LSSGAPAGIRTQDLQLTRLTIDPKKYKEFLFSKYARQYAKLQYGYVVKYGNLMDNPAEINNIPVSIRSNVIKSLIVLSKYLGECEVFRSKLKNHGIKTSRPDSLKAFLRILNASNSDAMTWYNSAVKLLRENERLFAKFLLRSGLRTSEAIHSFNLIITLAKEGKLTEYYDSELNVLCHFKYPKLFIRRTKCCFITFLEPKFLSEIANSQSLSYASIRKRLERKKMKLRLNELRDYFGTYLLNHGILEAEINLCQGRIPVDIFIRHYWSPKLKELGNRIFKALETVDKT
jgi:intergrase/recombinase